MAIPQLGEIVRSYQAGHRPRATVGPRSPRTRTCTGSGAPSTTGTTPGERRLLWGYWLLSGYGLRASRAFTWLLAAMTLTVLLLMGVSLPTHDPDLATTGTLHGSTISLSTSTPAPALHGGLPQRMTWVRA